MAFTSSVFVLSFQGDLPLYPYIYSDRPLSLVFFVLSFQGDLHLHPYLYRGRPFIWIHRTNVHCLFQGL